MTQYPRRDQHGQWVPWLSDYLRGLRALQAQGLPKPADQNLIVDLGHTLADLDPVPARDDPATLAALDQVQARERTRQRIEMEMGMDQDVNRP